MNAIIKQTTFRSTIAKFARDRDTFGHPIALTYKGNSTYKTVLGGTLTIIAGFAIFSYFLVAALSVINRQISLKNSVTPVDLT
jgi:hypothetical protein